MNDWIARITDPETRVGRAFDRIIYFLIFLSLALFALETLPEAQAYQRIFDWSEGFIVMVFTVEYILRTISKRRRFVLSFYGIIDLLAILPFYMSIGAVDLRSVRVLRVLRLLRIARLQQFEKALQRLRLAFEDIGNELAVYFGLTAVLIYLASVGIYYCENAAQPEAFRSVFHSMWWAVVTLSTVGYGDVYPITVAGRIFTFVILILGLSLVSVPSGLLASALVRQPKTDLNED